MGSIKRQPALRKKISEEAIQGIRKAFNKCPTKSIRRESLNNSQSAAHKVQQKDRVCMAIKFKSFSR